MLVFSILAAVKLEQETETAWSVILIPLWTVIFINYLSLAWEKIVDVKIEIAFISTLTTWLILLGLRLDEIDVPWIIVFIPVFLKYLNSFAMHVCQLFHL